MGHSVKKRSYRQIKFYVFIILKMCAIYFYLRKIYATHINPHPQTWFSFLLQSFFSPVKKSNYKQILLVMKISKNSITAVPIIMHSATPKQTDGMIGKSGFGDPTQFAYLPKNSSSRTDHLLIIIPGTFGLPLNYDTICMSAAKAGYYAFAVAYDNLIPIEFY